MAVHACTSVCVETRAPKGEGFNSFFLQSPAAADILAWRQHFDINKSVSRLQENTNLALTAEVYNTIYIITCSAGK